MKRHIFKSIFLVLVVLSPLTSHAQKKLEDFLNKCAYGTPAEVATALKAGASPNATDKDGNTPLMYALENGNNPKVFKLLIKAGAPVKTKNSDGNNVLMEMAKVFFMGRGTSTYDVVESAKLFLEAGCAIDEVNKEGKTALMLVAAHGDQSRLIFYLLRMNADAKKKSKEGKTAFDYAKTNPTGFLKSTKTIPIYKENNIDAYTALKNASNP
ncbi:hypothetical protein WSM22_19280 [Cytophagales bacterium WSM2-2]|nr:hypothetical protein WSM22_19280 [Cytophagales bacterium WSM2-2]